MSVQLEALSIAVQAGVPALLWGEPGSGKTSALRALARALSRHMEEVIAALREPSDFGGLPYLVPGNGVKLEPPAWALRVLAAKLAIIFFDELSCAPPAVQAALLRVVFDLVVGELVLDPKRVSIVAAANPPEQAAGGWDLAPPLANRFWHLDWQPDTSDWCTGMVAGWPEPVIAQLPKSWESHIPAAAALVASYISANRGALTEPNLSVVGGHAYRSRRSWGTTAVRLYAAAKSVGASEDVIALLCGGSVGHGAANEFLTWVDQADLPNPEDLIASPKNFKCPVRDDVAYAVLTSVASAVISNPTIKRVEAGWTIFEQAAKQDRADVAAVAVFTLAQHKDTKRITPSALAAFAPILRSSGLVKTASVA